jgi:hypothetical protein
MDLRSLCAGHHGDRASTASVTIVLYSVTLVLYSVTLVLYSVTMVLLLQSSHL